MRELTEEEKKFLNDVVKDHEETVLINEELESEKISLKRFRPKKIWFWFRPGFWISIVMLIPIILTAAILYIQTRVELLIGTGLLKFIASGTLDKQKEFSDGAGMEWLPLFLNVYNHKAIIIALSFTIAIVISIIILMLEYLVFKPRREQDEEYYD